MSEPTNAQLAATYGVAPRTIKRWRGNGAPLSDPKAMADFVAGLKANGRNAPAPVSAATAPTSADVTTTTSRKSERPADEPLIPQAIKAPDGTILNGEGLTPCVARMQAAELQLAEMYAAAIESGKASLIKIYGPEWLKLCAELRMLEKQLPEIQQIQGSVVYVADFRSTLSTALTEFRLVLERAGAQIQQQISARVPPEVAQEVRGAINGIHSDALEFIEALLAS